MPETWNRLTQRLAGEDALAILIELILIGLSVNWCASVLHGTRGTRLLKGMLIVLVVTTLVVRVLSVQMGWTRLELLYRYFIIGLGFIALVAFQPELRRAFMRAGDVRLLRRRKPKSKIISSLVEAARYLSRNNYGALVAIQRSEGLRNWAEHGTPLNAEVSANLLKTIFHPNTPLHDLGVIIQGSKVIAANCQFPSAETEGIDPTLGSRHRAAIGLSAESDALILIVSEETGAISLAENGRLTRYLALDDLEDELAERLSEEVTRPRRREGDALKLSWRFIRRALIVVPLTFVIWYLADQASQITAESARVQLDITHPADVQVDIEKPQPPFFDVDFRGSTRAIERLRTDLAEGPLVLRWSLPDAYQPPAADPDAGAAPREMTLPVAPILAGLPNIAERGLVVANVAPETLVFEVDRVVSVQVPLAAERGAAQISNPRFEPATVQVLLRQSDLAQIPPNRRELRVPLDEQLRGRAPGATVRLQNLPLPNVLAGQPLLSVSPARVDVSLVIVSKTQTRRLTNIPVQLRALSPQIWQQYLPDFADPNELQIEIEVEGEQRAVETLSREDVDAYLPISSELISPDPSYRPVEVVIDLPSGVRLTSPLPTVRIRLLERPAVPN